MFFFEPHGPYDGLTTTLLNYWCMVSFSGRFVRSSRQYVKAWNVRTWVMDLRCSRVYSELEWPEVVSVTMMLVCETPWAIKLLCLSQWNFQTVGRKVAAAAHCRFYSRIGRCAVFRRYSPDVACGQRRIDLASWADQPAVGWWWCQSSVVTVLSICQRRC